MNQPIEIPQWVLAEIGRLHLQLKLTEARVAELGEQVAKNSEETTADDEAKQAEA